MVCNLLGSVIYLFILEVWHWLLCGDDDVIDSHVHFALTCAGSLDMPHHHFTSLLSAPPRIHITLGHSHFVYLYIQHVSKQLKGIHCVVSVLLLPWGLRYWVAIVVGHKCSLTLGAQPGLMFVY